MRLAGYVAFNRAYEDGLKLPLALGRLSVSVKFGANGLPIKRPPPPPPTFGERIKASLGGLWPKFQT